MNRCESVWLDVLMERLSQRNIESIRLSTAENRIYLRQIEKKFFGISSNWLLEKKIHQHRQDILLLWKENAIRRDSSPNQGTREIHLNRCASLLITEISTSQSRWTSYEQSMKNYHFQSNSYFTECSWKRFLAPISVNSRMYALVALL